MKFRSMMATLMVTKTNNCVPVTDTDMRCPGDQPWKGPGALGQTSELPWLSSLFELRAHASPLVPGGCEGARQTQCQHQGYLMTSCPCGKSNPAEHENGGHPRDWLFGTPPGCLQHRPSSLSLTPLRARAPAHHLPAHGTAPRSSARSVHVGRRCCTRGDRKYGAVTQDKLGLK